MLLIFGGLILFPPKPPVKNPAASRRLVTAILHNDTDAVKAALRAGADPNAEMDGWAWTDFVHPLTNAIKGDSQEHLRDTPLLLTMDSLVKRDKNASNPMNGRIPLENLETVRALVEAGANIDARNGIGETPLAMAVSWGYSRTSHYLLEHKANPNLADVTQMTPCHIAASSGNVKLVKDLLDHGANPNATDMDGMTALFHAAMPPETPEQIAIVTLLLQYHADPTLKDSSGRTILSYTQAEGRPGIVSLLQHKAAQPHVP